MSVSSLVKKPSLILILSIMSVSFAAIFIVTAESPPLTIAFYRLLFTVFFIILFVLVRRDYLHELSMLTRSQILVMIGIGVLLSAHFALWITSLTKTSVASSVILVTAHPFIVTPLAYYFFHEKFHTVNILGICLSLCGVGILVFGNYNLSSMTLEGNVMALLGGMAAGGYILGGRKMRSSVSTPCYALVVYSVACVILFILCLVLKSPVHASRMQDYFIFFLLAGVSGLLGHTLYNWSLKYIPASIASVALLGEPLGSSLLAMIVPWINQTPSLYTLFGGIFIFLGIYYTSQKKDVVTKIR